MIANKYAIIKQIGKGTFGEVFEGSYLAKKEPVAIKLETSHIKILKNECTILNYLYSQGSRKTPTVFWFGKFDKYPALVMSFYSQSMEQVFQSAKQIPVEMIQNWVKQMWDIMDTIHGFCVVHRDVKPQNFMFKGTDLSDIYLIDFGLATVYVDEHKKPIPTKQNNNVLLGTPKFASFYIHQGWDPSCRDDLISVVYIWMYLLYGTLPWENIVDTAENEYDESYVHHSKNKIRMQLKKLENVQTYLGQNPKEGSDKLEKMIERVYL